MVDLLFQIAVACTAFYAAVTLFLLAGVLRTRRRNLAGREHMPTVSVVVTAHNEATKIRTCLQAILKQDYPGHLLEMVIVDDRSNDGTAEIIKEMAESNPAVQLVEIRQEAAVASPKKFALSQGIDRASGEIIFTTDADCQPPPQWIARMAPLFDDQTGIAIGLAPFHPLRHGLNRVLLLDNFASAFVAAGASGWNIGVTCTGRNLAYRKSVYEQVDGFVPIQHSLSGDDDLFLQLVRKRTDWRIACSLDAETAVPSHAPASITQFIRQKRRHLSAGKHYAPLLKSAYLLFNLANLVLFLFVIVALTTSRYVQWACSLFLLKIVLDFSALHQIARPLAMSRMLVFLPIWEVFNILTQIFVAPLAFVGRIRW